MQRSLVSAALAAFALLPLASCVFVVGADGDVDTHTAWSDSKVTKWRGSGVPGSQSRTLSDFREVRVHGSADVRIQVGQATGAVVRCDDNLLERVRTTVTDGVLLIELEPGSYHFRNRLEVDLATPTLASYGLDGSGDATISGLSGGDLRLGISGSGGIRASGTVDSLVASISGSGSIAARELATRRASVSIAGSGDAQVWASEALDVSISGSGDVLYRGNPAVNRSIAGSGSIVRSD
ncbi:MAG: DUF2807 domain-containing protein [Planctomycetaceae bacterium]|jgi:hypothetical protein|nr:DUF2807 domain-containing protein [Planctomycetaceae bacterium]